MNYHNFKNDIFNDLARPSPNALNCRSKSRIVATMEKPMVAPEKVNSFTEAADRLGIHPRTLQRMIADGSGPAIIRLSTRRVGILESDLLEWIAARRVGKKHK